MHTSRPALTPELTAEEFQRWYWKKDELTVFARSLGVSAGGGKDLLAARIAARLAGRQFTEPTPVRQAAVRQLAPPLSAQSVIPKGQRCSQIVRAWLTDQVGEGFHFDADMRAFFADTDGTQTLQDAVERWLGTRDREERNIDPQFEYNRFTRAWHASNPQGTREQLLAQWRDYRSRPIDERGRA